MVIKIGEKIKELRKKSDITQERFAEYLGVTAQAVSKWEVESGYPDIELLPSIANFFDVTIDELMGFDISKKQQKIDSILGDKEKALETANKFPFISRESVLAKIVGEYKETGIDISAQKGSVVLEGLELFADEKHIQPIVESLDSLLNVAGQINIDFADIVKIVKNNNAYFANYIPIKEIAEDVKHSRKNLVKGVIVDMKVSPETDLESVDTFMGDIMKSFGYKTSDIIIGVRFDDTMTGNGLVGSVIELSSYA